MNSSFKKMAIAAAVVVAAASSRPALAAPLNPFTIDPNVLDSLDTTNTGGNATSVVADRLNGGYTERLLITSPTTFSVTAFMNLTSYFDGGLPVDNTLSTGSGLSTAGGYNIYATFTASGTFSTSGGVTTFNATAAPGNVADIYVDPRSPITTFDTSDTSSFGATSGAGDDQLLASAALVSGNGTDNTNTSSCSPNCGSFGLIFQPTVLTTLGSEYFINPVPFYFQAQLNGDFLPFTVSAPPSSLIESGGGNLLFNPIPEPASLTLLGLGLVGMSRRKLFGGRRQLGTSK